MHPKRTGFLIFGSQKKPGSGLLRYTAKNAYRCFLPDLAGFTPRRYAGPLPGSYHFKHTEQNNQRGAEQKKSKGEKIWRREWDLNPRWSFEPHTRFPVVLLRPLGHLSSAPERLKDLNKTKNPSKPRTSSTRLYYTTLRGFVKIKSDQIKSETLHNPLQL